jgi:integrase
MLAILFGCGLRRAELAGLETDDIQTRQGHWAIVDLIGKGGHIRTVPIPQWAKHELDEWISAAGITRSKVFRAVARSGKLWGSGISENVVWYVVRRCCQRAGLEHIAPHDLRRTCAKLCHSNGGELEQIQFLLGHASVLTTERYLGCKQNLGQSGDLFDLNIEAQQNERNSEDDLHEVSTSVNVSVREDIELQQEDAQRGPAGFFPTGVRRCRTVELDTALRLVNE